MKRSVLATLVLVACLSFALACGSGCNGAAGAGRQRLVDTVEQFHRAARVDAEGALRRYQTPACREDLAVVLESFEGNWGHVFRPTVHGVSFLGRQEAVVVFYNPWSDLAFLALWQPQGETFGITEAELVTGDCIRKRGVPPFKAVRHWRRTGQAPALAVCESTYQTLEAFRRTFQRPAGASAQPATRWRQQLGGLRDEKIRGVNLLGSSLMLATTLKGLRGYREDPALAPVRSAAETALAELRRGNLAAVLQTADQTDETTRKELADEMPAKWAGTRPVAVVDSAQGTLVFLDCDEQAGLFASFLFRKLPAGAVLKRIDVMDLWTYYTYRRKQEEGGSR